MSHQTNITRIKAVHNLIKDIGEPFAFVGGATVSLYAQRETDEVRPTEDVDVVVGIVAYNAAYARLSENYYHLVLILMLNQASYAVTPIQG